MVSPVVNLTCAEQPGRHEAEKTKVLVLGIPPGCFSSVWHWSAASFRAKGQKKLCF